MSIKQELLVLFSGSFVNLLLFAIISLINTDNFLITVFANCNLVLGVMNLLPLNAFDGGKIINLIIANYTNINYSYKLINIIQIIILSFFFMLYLYFAINYSLNFSLSIIIIYAIYTIFKQ